MTKQEFGRRDALRMLGLGAVATGLSSARVLAWGPPQGMGPERKMLMIFLRGGWDGLHVAIPSGPAAMAGANGSYSMYTSIRDDIHPFGSADPGTAMKPAPQNLQWRARPVVLGATNTHPFCELNPALHDLLPIYANGHLGIVHRVGYPNSSFSHFTAQHFWETGRPGQLTFREGWPTRWAPLAGGGALLASGVSNRPQRWFESDQPGNVLPHFRRLEAQNGSERSFTFHETPAQETTFEQDLVAGLQAQAAAPMAGPPYAGFWDERTRTLLGRTIAVEDAVENIVAAGIPPGPYPVRPSTVGPDPWDLPDKSFVDEFGNALRAAGELLKLPGSRLVGVEIGGWDTHNDQIDKLNSTRAFGSMQERLATLGKGLLALYQEFANSPLVDLLTVCMSEFGRTSSQNGGHGTDHGIGGLMLAMGSRLQPGHKVYNFDASNFTGASFTDDPSMTYMSARTDFRTVLIEALQKQLGYTGSPDNVFAGYSQDAAAGPISFFQQLNYLQP